MRISDWSSDVCSSDLLRPQDASRAGTNKMPTLDDQSPHKRLSMLPVARPLFGRKQNCGNLLETGSRVVGVDSPQGEQLLRQSIMLARIPRPRSEPLQFQQSSAQIGIICDVKTKAEWRSFGRSRDDVKPNWGPTPVERQVFRIRPH